MLNGCRVVVVTAFPHYPLGRIPKEYRRKLVKVEWLERIKVIRTFILPLESRGIARRMFLFASFALSSLFAIPMVGRVDVIWASNPDILSIVPAMIYSRLRRCPVDMNVDDLAVQDVYDLKMVKKGSNMSRLLEFVARAAYRKARTITPVSPGYIEPISRIYGIEKAKIHLVRGGVDLEVFRPDSSPHSNDKRFVVLYSGAFSIAYNFAQVLNAAKIIEGKDKEIEFVLQGKGELLESIKKDIRRLKLRNVTVRDEILTREKVAKLLRQADVLVQPIGDFGSPHMGISSKLYEYQAVGKPIVCSSCGTPGLYVSQTRSGIVVEPGDHKALARAILYLKRNPVAARKMGQNGRKYVEKNASLEAIVLQLKLVLEKSVSLKK
jgi:glycosyltransferase involved in cell wall biosynthesis